MLCSRSTVRKEEKERGHCGWVPRTEVTQRAWERTVVITSQHPACYIRQEKCRRCEAFSLIISLDKSTSRRKEKKTTKNISDHSCDTTLRAQDLGLSGKLRSALNLCCLSRRTRKSRITAMWLSAQTKVRQWKIGGYEKKHLAWGWREKQKDLPTHPRNSFILFITVWGAYRYMVTNAGAIYEQ